ncbi:(p)ppGpp synthase/HD superfamily hydrolase [Parabacteroides sp. PFB2-10]|uniref:phosphohydrolase n=1 Tax=Parabacteroides sp. PFB2-10 TaxID=1742405 RepID=UPI00247490D9|nr:phosphohydrolase [Parabacteroides sp. PFB2-10]MDH6312661.1 (p)ppGpp synthase/HD superfamily hydrolase [Parabacteroides sp. PFB2-10]
MLQKAIQIATKAHEGQYDKSGMPYIGHVMRVMEAGKNDNEKIVAVLHDIVEDTDWTFEKLEEEGFATYIIDAIRCLTKTSEDEPYEEFIKRVQTNPLAVRVKINDLADNMDIRRLSAISEKDVERLRKYHKAHKRLTT